MLRLLFVLACQPVPSFAPALPASVGLVAAAAKADIDRESARQTIAGSQMLDSAPGPQPTPTVEEVEASLAAEDRDAGDKRHQHAKTYAVTYAIVTEFQNRGLRICLHAGSHLGALRHHGVIPFEEKDVDLALFSTDHAEIEDALAEALQPFSVSISKSNGQFGYQVDVAAVEAGTSSLSHYIDIWLFEIRESRGEALCVGWNAGAVSNGCQKWFRHFHAKSTPVFKVADFFPLRTAHFGTQRVPVPATNTPLETFPFSTAHHWNTTCGPSRRWTGNKWENVNPREKCSGYWAKHPFVFKKEGGLEQLRRGTTVLHEVVGVSRSKLDKPFGAP